MRKQLAIAAAAIGMLVALTAAPDAMAAAGSHSATAAATPQSPGTASANAASDNEVDTAKAGTPNFSTHPATCTTWDDSEACFQPNGDYIWVKDLTSDGHAAYGQWTNALRDGYGMWYGYREGSCNNFLGYGKWGYCSKDFYENNTDPNAYGGEGSEICVWASTWNGGAATPRCALNVN